MLVFWIENHPSSKEFRRRTTKTNQRNVKFGRGLDVCYKPNQEHQSRKSRRIYPLAWSARVPTVIHCNLARKCWKEWLNTLHDNELLSGSCWSTSVPHSTIHYDNYLSLNMLFKSYHIIPDSSSTVFLSFSALQKPLVLKQ